jgi:CheY-like chemotaxis protein
MSPLPHKCGVPVTVSGCAQCTRKDGRKVDGESFDYSRGFPGEFFLPAPEAKTGEAPNCACHATCYREPGLRNELKNQAHLKTIMHTTFSRITMGNPWRQALSRLAPLVEASPATTIATPARRKKILIVDDDPIILKTMTLKLTSQGYDTVCALDPSGAIGVMRDEKPDLILLDLSFPPDIDNGGRLTWDGFQLMWWLRGLEESGGIPFIIITAGDPAEYRERSLASGAVALFHKPIDHRDLLTLIRKALGEEDHAAKSAA